MRTLAASVVGVFAESTAHDRQFEDPIGRDINNRIGAIAAKCCPLLGKEQCSWTAADGLKFPLQQSSRWLTENQNHNSWSNHAHANDLFVFALDELMRCATINCPGSKLTVFAANLNTVMPFPVQGWLLTQLLGCNQRISSSSQDKKTQFSA